MANVKIHILPRVGYNGNSYVTAVQTEDPVDKNDKILLFVFDENVTGFSIDSITLTAVSNTNNDLSDKVYFVQSKLTGPDKSAVYSIALRPPPDGGSGTITITVAQNAVAEGNSQTTLTVPYSDSFPQSQWTTLFSASDGGEYHQIAFVDSERIALRRNDRLRVYNWSGTLDSSQNETLYTSGAITRLDSDSYLIQDGKRIKHITGSTQNWQSKELFANAIVHTRQSLALTQRGDFLVAGYERLQDNTITDRNILLIPIEDIHAGIQNDNDLSDETYTTITLNNEDADDLPIPQDWSIASDINNLYIEPNLNTDHYIRVYDSSYDAMEDNWIPIASSSNLYYPRSLFVYQNYLFRYNSNLQLQRLDLSNWKRPEPISKIYPQEVSPGQSIDLRDFIKYAPVITFDIGFKIPDWISLNSDRYLVIANDAPENATCYIRIIGINHVGASSFYGCMFYIQVKGTEKDIPVWENFTKLVIRKDQEINFFEYVRNADTILPVTGSNIDSFIQIENGILRVSGDGNSTTIRLRAGSDAGYYADKEIDIAIIKDFEDTSILNVVDYIVEIEGINVTEHLVRENFPSISHSLDWVKLNQFKRGRCSVSLYSNTENNGLFNSTNPLSFWETNNLNKSGFLNAIAIYVVLQKENGTTEKVEIFDGIIFDSDDSLNAGQLMLGCYDSSYLLKDAQLSENVRGIDKMLEFQPTTVGNETPAIEGIYRSENTAGEIIPERTEVWNDQRKLELKKISNLVDGVVEDNSAFATSVEIKTQGGYLHEDIEIPLFAKTEVPYRYLTIKDAAEKYIKNKKIKTTLHVQELDSEGSPHVRANGNLAFPTEKGRMLRYPVDWIIDESNSRLYYLLSNSSNLIKDQLICKDLKNGTHRILYEFSFSISTLKLASLDFDTFYIMAKESNDFDWTQSDFPIVSREIKQNSDASISQKTSIVKYTVSTDQFSTIVPTNTNYRPLSALHYWTGVSGKEYEWLGISEGDRCLFAHQGSNLLYRWARNSSFGVVSSTENGTLTPIFTETKDNYYNHLNFAFDIVGNDIYFAFTTGTAFNSTLTVKKRSGGTTTTVFTKTQSFTNITDLDDSGNAWLGVEELLVDGDDFYLIIPISRNGRDISTGAGVILYRYSLFSGKLFPLIKKDFVQHGLCMLVKYNNDIYFAESPAVTSEYTAKNRGLNYEASEAKGFLYVIRTSIDNGIDKLGNIYFDNGNAYNGQLPIKPLLFDDDINFIAGFGNIKTIGVVNSVTSNPENYQWFSYGKKYRYKLPILRKDGTIMSALTEIAGTTGSTLSIDKDIISIQDRQARGAMTMFEVKTTDTTIAYEFQNLTFPEKGYLLIGDELIRYTGKTDTYFTGITRGVLATDIQYHKKGELITYVKRIIEDKEKINASEPYLQVTVSLDSSNLYNQILEGAPQRISLLDENSREKYGELPLDLNLGTTEHDLPFAENISKQYLQRFKNLAYIINARVRAFFSINLGEFVCFKFLRNNDDIDGYLIAMQVMSIQTDGKFTTLRGREVTPIVESTDNIDISALQVTDGASNTFFADGASNIIGWYGSESYINVNPKFNVDSLNVLQLTQYQTFTPIVFPEAFSPIGRKITYTFTPNPNVGLIFDEQKRQLRGTPNIVQAATDYTYTATDEDGRTVTLTQSIEVLTSPY